MIRASDDCECSIPSVFEYTHAEVVREPGQETPPSADPPVRLEVSKESLTWILWGDQPPFRLDLSDNLRTEDQLFSVLKSRDIAWEAYSDKPDNIRITNTDDGYSTLNIWNCRDGGDDALNGQTLTPARLFLDFLFDLMHRDTFSKVKTVDSIQGLLKNHPLVEGIYAKADYYWHRRQHATYLENLKSASDRDASEATALIKAEDVWLDFCIKSDLIDRLDGESPWFDPVEDEIKRVLFVGLNGNRDWGQLLDEQVKMAPLPGQGTNGRQAGSKLQRISDFITGGNSSRKSSRNQPSRRRCICRWFLYRYDLEAALKAYILDEIPQWSTFERKFFGRHFFQLIMVALLLVPGLLVLDLQLNPDVLHTGATSRLPLLIKSLFVLSIPVLLEIAFFAWKRRPGFKSKRLTDAKILHGKVKTAEHFIGRLCLIGIATLVQLFVFLSWGAISPTAGDTASTPAYAAVTIIKYGPLIIMAVILIPLSVKSTNLDVFRLGLPRLVFSVAALWVSTALIGETWNLSLFATPRSIAVVGAPLLALCIIFIAVKIDGAIKDRLTSFVRAAAIVAVAFGISMYMGVLSMSSTGRPVLMYSDMMESEYLCKNLLENGFARERKSGSATEGAFCVSETENNKGFSGMDTYPALAGFSSHGVAVSYLIEPPATNSPFKTFWDILLRFTLFPWALVYRSCFVVFAALFLQFLFEDKNATEPF